MIAADDPRPGPTILRIAPVRWLVAELIPFACLLGGLELARVTPVAGKVFGVLIALIGGIVFTFYYLYRVLGAGSGWVVPMIVVYLPAAFLGLFVFGLERDQEGNAPRVTATYWDAWIPLLGLIAVIVALAVATGERWLRQHPRRRDSRGGLAWLWRPRQG